MQMYMEARVATYKGKITDILRRYSYEFEPFPFGSKEIHKWGMHVDREYIIMFSTADTSDYLFITVNGPSKKRVRRLMKDVKNKIGIETRKPPKEFYEMTEWARKLIYELGFGFDINK